MSKLASVVHLATGCQLFSLGMKGPRLKTNYLSSSSGEVKNEWMYTSTSLIHFHGVDRETFM
jgi:hypothetical protein